MEMSDARKKAHEALCVRDERSPYHVELDEPIPPRKNCGCDNCYCGKDELALIIIELLDVLISTGDPS